MRFGIIAPHHYPLQPWQSAAAVLGVELTQVRTDVLAEQGRFCLSHQNLQLDGQVLPDFTCLWLTGFVQQEPLIPKSIGEHCDWSVWQYDYVADQQRYSLLRSLLAEAARRVPCFFNPPEAYSQAFYRPAWMMRLAGAGVPVVPLWVSNQRVLADRLLADFPQGVVWRPVTGRAKWQRFTTRQRDALLSAEHPPVCLAPATEGPVIRSYLAAGQIVAHLEHSDPFRDPYEHLERVWVSTQVSQEAEAWLLPCATHTAADWLCVTWVAGAQGPQCYDVEVDPLLDWLPDAFQSAMRVRVLSAFLGKPLADVPAPEQAAERPAFMLRRMLDMLYEMEASKYPDASAGGSA